MEAQEEAGQLNVINQSVIGAKEGVVKAITKLVGSDVTNAILRTANNSNHKSINDFTLFEVMKSAINDTDRPSTNGVLEQLLKIINHSFDFRKKISVNMELMQLNAAWMATYGIVIGIPQLTLTLLANIKTATKSNHGHEFCSAMHAICKKYTYNHVHDATLLQLILKELAGADGVRVLKDAPAPGTGTTHSVAESVSYLQAMMGEDTNSTYTELAYGVSSDSGLSEDWAQEIPMLQVARWLWETEEGKRWRAKEECVPPLQKVLLQEAPSSWTGQVHVEQEVQGLPLQIYLGQAWSGIQTMLKILEGVRQVCKQG